MTICDSLRRNELDRINWKPFFLPFVPMEQNRNVSVEAEADYQLFRAT